MKKSLLLLSSLFILGGTPVLAQNEDFFKVDQYENVHESGTYKIGDNLEAGEYRLIEVPNSVFPSYQLTEDANQEEFIASGVISGHDYIKVEDGQYLKITDSFLVPVEDVKPIEITDNTISDGAYKVGFDIPAGEYEVKEKEDSIFPVFTIFKSLDEQYANSTGVVENNAYLEVEDGDYLRLSDVTITHDNLVTQKP